MQEKALWYWRSSRLHIVLMLMFCYFCSSLVMSSFSLNLQCMVVESGHGSSGSKKCQSEEESKKTDYGGTLNWTRHQQDMLYTAMPYGSITMQLPSMFIARMAPSRIILLIVMIFHVLLNAAIPFFAINVGFDSVYAIRVIIGMVHSFLDVSIYSLVDKWFPLFERSTALAIFAVGGQIAGIVGGPLTGHICQSSLGWQWNFYITSLFATIFCLIWFLFSSESPKSCKNISPAELAYLVENVHVEEKTREPTPFKKMLTSIPVLAIFQLQLAVCVAEVINQSYMPRFYKEAVMISAVMNGYFIAIPNVFSFITRLTSSTIIDFLKRRGYLGQTRAVKIAQGTSTSGIIISCTLLALAINCNTPALALFISCILSSSQALESPGERTSLLSLAPRFTEPLSAISMFFSHATRIATSYAIDALRKDPVHGWEKVFLMAAGVNVVCGTIFMFFGSGKEQEWAKKKLDDEEILDKTESEDGTSHTSEA